MNLSIDPSNPNINPFGPSPYTTVPKVDASKIPPYQLTPPPVSQLWPPPDRSLAIAYKSNPGHLQADPAALTAIASTLDTMVQPLSAAVAELDGIAPKPGAYDAAHTLRDLVGGIGAVGGATSLVATYRTNVSGILDAFKAMRDGLNKMAKDYKSAEDMATGDANTVQADMSPVVGALGGNAPNAIPNYTPPKAK